ncbi:uncharacterized protein Z520_02389 [Fonsecaea multimorphosa CBS 102226]|uniref:Amino acid permease/ SLC12A domain-containing protein n=1 Tax=Fonsecaea multimorphosa CBS 102226 TaxID=1442371 RepID=A0A0D2HK18_9EURO|nr:uncharacterized protein Z520_02389 [Fonsecaea multimorphosa CBS 102226]KIY02251.1 hypothetical protein Z520_02389 [Fonsecaea multimorphosa CBS 102226]OAL28899.1 hypothetical protein AYO22_02335 [Fonsecaea multimorphosa]
MMDTKENTVLDREVSEDVGIIVADNSDQLRRKLGNRQIQLLTIGGAIGTGLFVSIGGALNKGGPAGLFLGWFFYCCIEGIINNGMAEMTTYMPVSGGYLRQAGKWVDDALGFMAGWNFLAYIGLGIPFEITAISLVLSYWRDDIPIAAVCVACIVLYAAINLVAVHVYGEAEFWLSSGKVFLILILYSFTFIAMVGGNPRHDAFGFRYWNNPGAFAEYAHTGTLGQFEGFLYCFFLGPLLITGPEYLSMVAGETKHPRVYLKRAFKTIYWRFAFIFIGGPICVGICIAYNDPTLVAILQGVRSGKGTANASPYVIAMQNLGVEGLPHLVNALLITSIFSAGNTYIYVASRILYGLALEGRAPAVLKRCTKSGVPIYCLAFVLVLACLSLLQLSAGTAQVLSWLVNIITGAGIINCMVMTTTYLCWYRACKKQGIDRKTLPYFARFQPWSTWIALVLETLILIFYGYATFLPGWFNLSDFFSYYTMVGLSPILYFGWKFIKRTKIVKSTEADLIWERPLIDAYEASIISPPIGFWTEMLQLVGFRRHIKDDERA